MKKTLRLHLSTETLRRLTVSDMSGIVGGQMRSYNTVPCSDTSKITKCIIQASDKGCETQDCHEATTDCTGNCGSGICL